MSKAFALLLFLGTCVRSQAQTPAPIDTCLFYKSYVIFEPDSFRLFSGGGISAATQTWAEGADPKIMRAACDKAVSDLLRQGWVVANETVDKRGKRTFELRHPKQ